ncbi:hypothetical protein DEU32_10876 [Curtobacterium sp. AG1037]|uniref:hypothetical protein n=1 Tax=Curtobacterium sp. AG1037 TaxID=2183990 RepID=UPI000E2C1D70|nr:hypothetical protein [Curtobacterium sp. AG1037]RDH96910.1 hypothetical protein DEU32_10876 [Curtobacterium sp. AG1037]
MHRSTSSTRRACALGTTVALIGLTTGLGVFTSTAAFAVDEPTSAVAPADPSSTGTTSTTTDSTGAGTTATDTTGSATSTPTDAATAPSGTGTSTDAAPAPTTGDTAAPAPTTTSPAPSTTTKAAPSAVAPTATSSATIVGAPKVGVTLFYKTTGIDDPRAAWTVEGGTPVVASSFEVTADMVGKTITLTVTGSAPGQTATETTAAVSEDVAFAAETSYESPRTIEVTAGDTLDEVFGVSKGSGTVEYSIGYADPENVDPETDTPEGYLPFDTTFDAATATLSGRVTYASVFDFTVVATNGTSTATEYVEVIVDPAKAVGVMAQTTNTSPIDLFDGEHPFTGWVIEPDGHITTFVFSGDPDQEPTVTDGGQPTVAQGQSLWINGSPVDEFGNDTTRYDDEGNADQVTVTSDHATDQIAIDEDTFSTKVTFPHASTHVLTVTAQSASVSFPVTVVPTAAPAGTVGSVTPAVATAPKGQLAFTGTDATSALPWALGFVAAGAGLLGAGVLRRRRAQR